MARTSLDVAAPELGGKARLVLDYEAPPADSGYTMAPSCEKPRTFRLSLVKPDGKSIPITTSGKDGDALSRGGLRKYGIAEAYLLPRAGKPPVVAVLVQVFTQGSEGPDRNFIPMAAELPPS